MESKTPSLILLAAGLSTRSGPRHKLTTELGRQLALVRGTRLRNKIVVLSKVTRGFVTPADLEGITAVVNPDPARGMMSSIQLGIASAPEKCGFLITLADLPELSPAHLETVLAAAASEDYEKLIAPSFEGQRGHPVFIPAKHRAEILEQKPQDRGLKFLWQKYPSRELLVDDPAYVRDRDD